MKKKYIKPRTEAISNEYLCQPEATWKNASQDPGTQEVGTRETEFMEDESEDNAMGYRRYNLWEE